MNTQQALNIGFQKLNDGDLLGAASLFERVLALEPSNFAALNGRAFIALQQNRLPQSLADFQQSLAVNAKQPFARKMEAIVLGALGRFDASMEAFTSAIVLDRKDPEIFFNRSTFRYQAGLVQEALADLDEAIKLRPSYLEARSNRANLLMHQADFSRAEKDLDYLVGKVTNNPDIWVALGLVRYRMGKLREAMQCNERALRLVANHPDALLNSASTTFEQKDYVASLAWANKGISAAANRAELYYAKANALAAMSRFDESLTVYDQALQINPGYVEALNARGLAKAGLRHLDEAVEDYDKAIALRPEYHDAIYNKSYAQLEHGDFEGGWLGYERRFHIPAILVKHLPGIPVWHGEALAGRLLVRGEQGLGDQILFASVLPDLEERIPNIVLQIEPRLVPLFQRSFSTLKVVGNNDRLPEGIAAQITIGSLPQFFRRSAGDFQKARHPYLVADAIRTETYWAKLGGGTQRIVGLSWRSFNNRFTAHKSMNLLDLAPLFAIPDVNLVDLQYGDTAQEKLVAEAQGLSFNEAASIDLTKDIDGLASLISACDVVVTVSNTTAHIAGALGKPVLLMLPYRIGKLWYWSEVLGGHSLWYPTVAAFHQTQPDSWAGTINAVKASLMGKV